MDVIKLANEERIELIKNGFEVNNFSLTPEGMDELRKSLYFMNTFQNEKDENYKLLGYPIVVNPFQTKPVIALRSPNDEWFYRRQIR